jgi:hypothetical protein
MQISEGRRSGGDSPWSAGSPRRDVDSMQFRDLDLRHQAAGPIRTPATPPREDWKIRSPKTKRRSVLLT